MHETRVWPLGWEDPLEKGLATHSSILAWRIPWTEEPGELQSMRLQRQTQLKRFSMHASCNPGEIWQAANSRLWCGDGGKWIDSKYILITYNRKKSQKGHHIYIYICITLLCLKHFQSTILQIFLYSFNYWRTFRLLLCLSYCKKYCYEHWGVYIFWGFVVVVSCIFLNQNFLLIHVQEWACLDYTVTLFLVFFYFYFLKYISAILVKNF